MMEIFLKELYSKLAQKLYNHVQHQHIWLKSLVYFQK